MYIYMCIYIYIYSHIHYCEQGYNIFGDTDAKLTACYVHYERCSVMQCGAVWCSVVQCVAVCCSVLQRAAVCCSVLQRVAACSMLQCAMCVESLAMPMKITTCYVRRIFGCGCG